MREKPSPNLWPASSHRQLCVNFQSCAKIMSHTKRSGKSNPLSSSHNKKWKSDPSSTETCRGCRKQSHGGGKVMIRRGCPAFRKKCSNCEIMGHFKIACSRLATDPSQSSAAYLGEDMEDQSLNYLNDPSFASATTSQNQDFRQTHHIIGYPLRVLRLHRLPDTPYLTWNGLEVHSYPNNQKTLQN